MGRVVRTYKGFKLIGHKYGDGHIGDVRVILRTKQSNCYDTLEAAQIAVDTVTSGVQYIEIPKPKKVRVKKVKPEPSVKVINAHRNIVL